MNYTNLLTEKINERNELLRQLETFNNEIELLQKLVNLNTASSINITPVKKTTYTGREIALMPHNQLKDIIESNICEISYIKGNGAKKVFKRASMCADYRHEAFDYQCFSNNKPITDKEGYVFIIHNESLDFKIKKLVTERIIELVVLSNVE